MLGYKGESCAEAIHSVLKPREVVSFSDLYQRVHNSGAWKNETIWQHLMSCVVNLPPARHHWRSRIPFLFLHPDGRYELFDETKHPSPIQ